MRANGRRHRAWRWRSAQPVLLAPDEPLLITGLAALGRVPFRYRSEPAPVTTAVALKIAAVAVHHTDRIRGPGWLL